MAGEVVPGEGVVGIGQLLNLVEHSLSSEVNREEIWQLCKQCLRQLKCCDYYLEILAGEHGCNLRGKESRLENFREQLCL